MSPELFDTYTQMRNRELRRTAARQRLAAAAQRRRRTDLLVAARSWVAERFRHTPRRIEPCPTC